MIDDPADDATGPDDPASPRRAAGLRTVLIGLVLAVAAVIGAAGANWLTADDGGGMEDQLGNTEERLGPISGEESDPLPDAVLATLAGDGEVDPRDYAGTPLVMNFWATWCAPCVAEMPEFQQAFEELDGRVAFLGVNLQDDTAAAQRFADELGITYDLAEDGGDYFTAISGFGMPTTLLVDADGTIVYRHTGALELDDLRDLLAEHLGVEEA
jgi:cytochrome c biogenesis protein CcmG, thiol:disulfide interchange protein DsbE